MPRPSLLQVVVVLLVAMLGLMAVSAAYRARSQRSTTPTPAQPAPAPVAAAVPAAPALKVVAPSKPAAPPAKPAPKPQPTFSIAHVRAGGNVALRSKPGGPVLARVPSTTQFGSPTTFAVAATRGDWVGMTSTNLPNGKLGWVKRRRRDDLRTTSTHLSLRADLSARRLELRDGRKVIRRMSVGIGRPGSPTPTGRILALSGHQGNTPAGWQGGDRLAIHGTNNPGTIGVPSSAGCLHADAEDLRAMMRRVPLGTPVFIHA
jgi:lipoprotein-anchoring transpeptidase ErfK/SrfK